MIPLYIKKYCCYTLDIQNYRFIQGKIFYASYENTADLINEKNDLNITRQSVYLYEREACRTNLAKKRTRTMENNKQTRNKTQWEISLR